MSNIRKDGKTEWILQPTGNPKMLEVVHLFQYLVKSLGA
jgi:hypothetical protein